MPDERIQTTIKLTVAPDDDWTPPVETQPAIEAEPQENLDLPRFDDNLTTLELVIEDSVGGIYKVHNHGLNQEFTVRLIAADKFANPEAEQSFLRFLRRCTTITHPSLLSIYQYGQNEHGIWLVSDYCESMTLEQLMANHAFQSEGMILDIFSNLLDAIENLQSLGIKYGATHPRSIYVNETTCGHSIRLRDWWLPGLLQAQQTALDTGSLQYASPEQLEEKASSDARSDIFSFGVALYKALCGRLPHYDPDGLKLAIKIMRVEPPAITGRFASSELGKIAMRCLQKDPEQRYKNIADLRDDFKQAARGKNVSTATLSTTRQQQRQSLHKWLLFWLAFTLSYCLLSGVLAGHTNENARLMSEAFEAEASGDYALAESLFRSATAANPEDSASWYNLGRIRAIEHEFEGATAALQTAIAMDPQNAEAYAQLGQVQLQMDEPELAISTLGQALSLYPDNWEAQTDLSKAYLANGQLSKAIEAGKKAVSIEPDDAVPHLALANAYEKNAQRDKAEEAYKKALSIEPENAEALAGLARVLEWKSSNYTQEYLRKKFPGFHGSGPY